MIFRQRQFIQVAGCFTIGVFPHAQHDIIGSRCCYDGLLYFGRIFLVILPVHFVGYPRFVFHVVRTKLILQRLENGVVLPGKLFCLFALPRVAPAAVKCAHGISIRPCHQNAFAWLERKDGVFIFQQRNRLIGSSLGDGFVLNAAE
ncbi:hypothetical protein SDC9_128248 [bioreactor metagenome]|uniref:Uncharacterized protein n=1 Tax=bioreactor metagenome TaxID=1076179 RepID=A0A645CVN6_9ZZZZ